MGSKGNPIVLKWGNHDNQLLKGLQQQRKMHQFMDVTLAVGEESIQAHRIVLCACSTYFCTILTRLADCSHPVIVLKDTTPDQLKALVDYMYTGKMSVDHQDYDAIVRAAGNLGIHLSLPPLATSELTKDPIYGEKAVLHNRPGSQSGRKSYRPKRLRTSLDSGNASGSVASSDLNNTSPNSLVASSDLINTSPNSLVDRSYPSCPSRESESPSNHSSHDEESHTRMEENSTPSIIKKENGENSLSNVPMDYSTRPNSHSTSTNSTESNKEKRLSILDSLLKSSVERSTPGVVNLPPLHPVPALVANPSNLAAAQNLAWLSQQNFPGIPLTGPLLSEGDKENRQRLSTSLPLLGMDIAGKLQKALWAANFNKDNPYGAWMNQAMKPGFAATAITPPALNTNSPLTAAPRPLIDFDHATAMFGRHFISEALTSGMDVPVSGRESPSAENGLKSSDGRMGSTMASISGKPTVECEICGKRLADPSSLYRHRKIHSGDKPHKCPYCGRKFIQRYNMTQHIRTHFKDRGINSLASNGLILGSNEPDNNGSDRVDLEYSKQDGLEEENEENCPEEEIEPC